MNKTHIAENSVKKKVEKIKNAKVTITVEEDCIKKDDFEDNILYITINVDQMIEPQMRPRTRGFGGNLYDPLSKYKKIFKEKVKNALEEIGIDEIELSEDAYVYSEIELFTLPPKNLSGMETYEAITNKHNYKYNKKPDIDNCIKTIYDSLEKIFFFNDSQVVKETTSKYYSYKEGTIIKFEIHDQPKFSKKINKKFIDGIKDVEIKKFLQDKFKK